MAAPMATASSGLTDKFGDLPVKRLTNSWTAGILIEPPINKTWFKSLAESFASAKARRTGSSVLFKRCFVISWNFARLNFVSKLMGPSLPIPMNGSEIVVSN